MRAASLAIALALVLGGCTSSLALGDRALFEHRPDDAVRLWRQDESRAPDAVLFRLASVAKTREERRTQLTLLVERFPDSPYGLAAKTTLDEWQQRERLEARVRALEGTVADAEKREEQLNADLAIETGARSAAVAAAHQGEADVERLSAELKSLREQIAAMEDVRDEASRLRDELEAVKLIDLHP